MKKGMKKRLSRFMSSFSKRERKGDIWVETVIYTLIALTMMGLVLAFVVPKIDEIQDKSVIEQSVNLMKDMNNVILSVVQGGPGNKRLVEATIKKGTLIIDSSDEKIFFTMETDYVYSEYNEEINIGNIKAITKKVGGTNNITLTTYYDYEIVPNEIRRIEHSTTPYIITIENTGESEDGKTKIDISVT